MRSRIFAFIILFSFLVIPGCIYWYIFYENTTSITLVSSESGTLFHASLQGRLEYEYLPLADKILGFQKVCDVKCTIDVPPTQYDIILTSSGKEEIHITMDVGLGDKQTYLAHFIRSFSYVPIVTARADSSLEASLLSHANSAFGGVYSHIGTGIGGKYLALRTRSNISEIGVITPDKFLSIKSLPFTPRSGYLDKSRRYIILSQEGGNQFIISLDGMKTKIFPYSENIEIVDSADSWKVTTKQNVYTLEGDRWRENPRFTDYIDISPSTRIGYIDAKDRDKLILQNLPQGIPVIISVNRFTGKSEIMKTGLSIMGFFTLDGAPTILLPDGTFGALQFK